MRKTWLAGLALLCFLLAGAQMSMAADVALTPVGQSPDAMMVKIVLKKMGIKAQLNKMLKAQDLGSAKVVVAVVGGSSKGLGAAGIDKEQEIQRVQNLLKAAKDKGVKVLVMHIGAKGRRGKLSDSFIGCAVPMAEKVIVVKGGNADGIFDKLIKGKDVELLYADNVRKTSVPLKKVLGEWGLL